MTAAYSLTPDQISFFDTFGYLHLPGWFKEDAATLAAAFDEQFERYRDEVVEWKHSAHYDKPRYFLGNLPDRSPTLFNVLADPRLQTIAIGLAGERFIYVPSEGNIFTGDTVWHTDDYNPYIKIPDGHPYFKIALYLDPMTHEHGGFRVIPGSHHPGKFHTKLHKQLHENTAAYGLTPEDIPCTILESQPGDVVIFNHRTQHATCHTTHRRRMLYFGITGELRGDHVSYAKSTAEAALKAFGKVYAEPLGSSQNPLLKQCTQQLRDAARDVLAVPK